MTTATAQAFANIAFVKYWGNQDGRLNLPSNGSISMNLGGLITRTSVIFDESLKADELSLNGRQAEGVALRRTSLFLDRVRELSGMKLFARVESSNNFPMGAGVASSASAFAALSMAASTAAGLSLSEKELSRLARRGSGSACRSVPGGFVEWQVGADDQSSFAFSIASPEHWGLADCIAMVSSVHKATGSNEGHALAESSPLQAARLARVQVDLAHCRQAIISRDFETLAEVVELESNLMHAVMITSRPPLIYWQPATLQIMMAVREWRKSGVPACYTVDAGPNVHVLCPGDVADQIARRLDEINGVEQVLISHPGGAACLVG